MSKLVGVSDRSDNGGFAMGTVFSDATDLVASADASVIWISEAGRHRVRAVLPNGTIATRIGRVEGVAGYAGDGGHFSHALLNSPMGLATLAAGLPLWIADMMNHRVRRVDENGTMTTVAGSGDMGYSGDGHHARCARMSMPVAVAVNADGTLLWISDSGNAVVRLVHPNHVIVTIVGTGVAGDAGDGGPAFAAQLSGSFGGIFVRPDGAQLWIADTWNNRIRTVFPNGTIATVAGHASRSYGGDGGVATEAGLFGPLDIAVDGAGNLWISDSANQALRVVDATTGIISTRMSALRYGKGVAVSADGARVWVVESLTSARLRMLNTSTNVVTTVAGGFTVSSFNGDAVPAAGTALREPGAVAYSAVDATIVIADTKNNRLRRVHPNGTVATLVGSGNGYYAGHNVSARLASINRPAAVALDVNSDIWFSDTNNHRVRRIDALTEFIFDEAGSGSRGYTGDGGHAHAAKLNMPGGIALVNASDSGVWIADTDNHCVRWLAPNRTLFTLVGTGVAGFAGENAPAAGAQLWNPRGLAVNRAATMLWIADAGNVRIRVLTLDSGMIRTIAGNGTVGLWGDGGPAASALFFGLAHIAITEQPAFRLWIADSVNHRIRRIDDNGIIVTVAGTDESGYNADAGPARAVSLTTPMGVAYDPHLARLIVADTANHVVRVVTDLDASIPPSPSPTFSATPTPSVTPVTCFFSPSPSPSRAPPVFTIHLRVTV